MGIHLKPNAVYFRSMFCMLSLILIVAVEHAASNMIQTPPNCSTDEDYGRCGNVLDATCEDPDLNEYFVSLSDCRYACSCKPGLVRPDIDSRECIPLKDCPKKGGQTYSKTPIPPPLKQGRLIVQDGKRWSTRTKLYLQ